MLKQLLKNLASSLIILVLTIVSFSSALASFPDTTNHKYSTAIDWVQADGIVSGYPDGTYGPDIVINRAEFTKIIVEATVGGTISGSNCFPDVGSEWFAPYVCTAKDHGIVGGNDDGTFKPGNEVNYAEALKIVLEAYSTDFPRTTYEFWYSKYVEYALDGGLSFASSKLPHSFVTRGEMAELIYWINNPQTDVTPTTTTTTIPAWPANLGKQCTVNEDCAPSPIEPYCDGNLIMLPKCIQGVCIEEVQVDCAVTEVGKNKTCGDTGKGFVECYEIP